MTNKRYLPPGALIPFLDALPETVVKSVIGQSVNDLPIHLLSIGKGVTKILIWSQMHGNESTTTRALLDFIPWFLNSSQKSLQEAFALSIILQLNPDGAETYTRLNANNVDLNRDAINLSQPESKALNNLYHTIKPDYCLNLHGQRTIFSAGKKGETASLSFLAPSANIERTVTPPRKKAMQLVVALKKTLEKVLPNQIGRYDDSFNPNCVGDKFTQLGSPTILFEAGHVSGDYQREITRKHLLTCLKTFLKTLITNDCNHSIEEYFNIPENAKDFIDLIISGVTVIHNGKNYFEQELAIQYQEKLKGDNVIFIPVMVAFASKIPLKSHKKIKLSKGLIDSPLHFNKRKMIKISNLTSLI